MWRPLMSSTTGGWIYAGGRGLPTDPVDDNGSVAVSKGVGGWMVFPESPRPATRGHRAGPLEGWAVGRKFFSLLIGLAIGLRVSDTRVAPSYHSTCDVLGSRTLYSIGPCRQG